MPNRVAELESTVAQLSATVDGLRGELVDANERIRSLEEELDHLADEEAEPSPEPRSDGGEEQSAQLDDIIVA